MRKPIIIRIALIKRCGRNPAIFDTNLFSGSIKTLSIIPP
jgi:hypothetical protein